MTIQDEVNAARVRLRLELRDGFSHDVGQWHGCHIQLHVPRFDLREIEDAVDQRQQIAPVRLLGVLLGCHQRHGALTYAPLELHLRLLQDLRLLQLICVSRVGAHSDVIKIYERRAESRSRRGDEDTQGEENDGAPERRKAYSVKNLTIVGRFDGGPVRTRSRRRLH